MVFELAECQRVIGYHFANPRLLEVALTHSSLRTPDRECNERLEFLGDSVLGLVVTEELYRLLPDQEEGELTRLKSAIVSRGALFRASQRLGLARFADFARGVGRHDELPVSVIANLVEAAIGAIYLDAGYFPAREFVLRHLGAELDETLNDRGAKNYKSLLQHAVQESVGQTPTYRTVEEGGPDHHKQFVVAALIRGQEWGRAEGSTKKEAEQEAAHRALEAFQRRGRGRRRRHAGRDDGARAVAAHVDDAADLAAPTQHGHELAPDIEAGALDPAPAWESAPAGEARRPVLAPEPDVEPPDTPASAPAPAPAPAPRPRPGAGQPARRASAEPRPGVAAAAQAPTHDGFALGLDLPPAAPVSPGRKSSAPERTPRAPARKKAPAAWTPPPEDEGFGSGL